MIDTPRPDRPLARRTLPTNPNGMILNGLIIIILLFLFNHVVPLIFFAVQAAQENGHFTALGYAAIVCISLSFLWMSFPPLALLLPSVSAIMILIDRIHRDDFNTASILYVAFTFAGLLPGCLYAVLWDVILRDYAYKAWLATFEEDWDTNGKYKIWWRIFGANLRLMRVIRAAERRLRLSKPESRVLKEWKEWERARIGIRPRPLDDL